MAQLRYLGEAEHTLIDVAALTKGKVFSCTDEYAKRLLTAFEGLYERVTVDAEGVVTKVEEEVKAVEADIKSAVGGGSSTPPAPVAPVPAPTEPVVPTTPATE